MIAFGARRAARLVELHAELRSLLRTIQERNQADLWQPSLTGHLSTVAAATAERTITVTPLEAHDLVRASLPPSTHDATTRMEHALLVIALRHCMDSVCRIDSDCIAPGTIVAAQLLHEQLGAWLKLNNVVVMKRGDTGRTDVRDRAREPKGRIARRRLNIPLLLRHPATSENECSLPSELLEAPL